MHIMKKHFNLVVLAAGLVLAWMIFLIISSSPSYAIPAFSRKYQTSCSTCHNDFPELNDFGLAFKKNGFKFPKDDESFVKEPPVLLGARAQKEAFPNAIYPGEIPGSVPIAFRYSGVASYHNQQPLAIGFQPRSDLFAPNTFTIISAGSFGPDTSWWVDNDISSGGSNGSAGLGDAYLKYNDLSRFLHLPKDSLNVRFGQFELDLPFTQARTINPSGYDIYSEAAIAASGAGLAGFSPSSSAGPPAPIGANNMVFGIPQRGVEFGGYPNDGNFWWSVALVNGNNSSPATRNTKDVYVNVWQQFNLERDPAVRSDIQAAGPTGPRDHTSLRLGAFYYYGDDELNQDRLLFPSAPTAHFPFFRAGGQFRFKYRQFELYGLGMYGHTDNLQINSLGNGFLPARPVTFSGGFLQSEYWIHPWLIGIMRYDVVNSPMDFLSGTFAHTTRNRFSPGMQLLFRANIKGLFEYQYSPEVPVGTTGSLFRPKGFVVGMDFLM